MRPYLELREGADDLLRVVRLAGEPDALLLGRLAAAMSALCREVVDLTMRQHRSGDETRALFRIFAMSCTVMQRTCRDFVGGWRRAAESEDARKAAQS